jgi:hypothetical protein
MLIFFDFLDFEFLIVIDFSTEADEEEDEDGEGILKLTGSLAKTKMYSWAPFTSFSLSSKIKGQLL